MSTLLQIFRPANGIKTSVGGYTSIENTGTRTASFYI